MPLFSNKHTTSPYTFLGSLGQGMLAASGPSRMPITAGQVFGSGLAKVQQDQDRLKEDQYKQALLGLELKKYQEGLRNPEKTSAIQNYEYVRGLNTDDRKLYFRTQRAPQVVNLGGTQMVLDPSGGSSNTEYTKTPLPEQMPEFKRAQQQAEKDVDLVMNPKITEETEKARDKAEKSVNLRSMQSKMHQLRATVDELYDLADKASFTMVGKARDFVARQTGMPTPEAADARAKYIALIDNQVLPLLRNTFGAQFTENEGKALRATLGDPDLSPSEKKAVLDAFISQKEATIASLQREVGQSLAEGVISYKEYF